MNTELILHTVLGLLLLLIPAGALYLLECNGAQSERKMLKSFGFAIVRMTVQLLVLCLMVWVLILFDRVWLSLLWLLLMSVYSAWIVVRKCKLKSLIPVAAGLFLGVLLVGLWLLGPVFPIRAFTAQWFVPVMALLLGHSTAMMIRGLSTYVSALKADKEQYEFLRGNGQPHLKALMPFLRRALLAVISPTVANLSVLGLFSMPLLLGGIFLGGVSPINAFFIMLQMIVGCISASVLSLGITIYLYDKLSTKQTV